jgi:hypothetical protein
MSFGEAGARPVRLGIKPTADERRMVRALAITGISVRDLCARLASHYGLDRPMTRGTLYHHFRAELEGRKRGRKPGLAKTKLDAATNLLIESRRLMQDVKERTAKKNAAKLRPI